MNSLKPAFPVSHTAAGRKRLLIAVLAVLLLGALTAIPALASGSGTWTTTGSLHTARTYQTATLLQNGQVLVAGGVDSSGNELASAELYDPATGQWTLTGSMSTVRAHHAATLLPNGQVLVAGGQGINTTTILASAELYNPATGTWTTTGSMNFARFLPTATLLTNGQVLVAGGYNYSPFYHAVAIAELYSP